MIFKQISLKPRCDPNRYYLSGPRSNGNEGVLHTHWISKT